MSSNDASDEIKWYCNQCHRYDTGYCDACRTVRRPIHFRPDGMITHRAWIQRIPPAPSCDTVKCNDGGIFEEEEKEEIKPAAMNTCGTCKFADVSPTKMPCRDCDGEDEWTPRQTQQEEMNALAKERLDNVEGVDADSLFGRIAPKIYEQVLEAARVTPRVLPVLPAEGTTIRFKRLTLPDTDADAEKQEETLIPHTDLRGSETNIVKEEEEDSIVEHPNHYTDGKIELWDWYELGMTDVEFVGGLKMNILKYVGRAGKKYADKYVEDLEKARAYLNRWIRFAEGQRIVWTRGQKNSEEEGQDG